MNIKLTAWCKKLLFTEFIKFLEKILGVQFYLIIFGIISAWKKVVNTSLNSLYDLLIQKYNHISN